MIYHELFCSSRERYIVFVNYIQLWGSSYYALNSPVCHNIISKEISNRWKTCAAK